MANKARRVCKCGKETYNIFCTACRLINVKAVKAGMVRALQAENKELKRKVKNLMHAITIGRAF